MSLTQKFLVLVLKLSTNHCVNCAGIRKYSGPLFPSFGLNTERYAISLRIQSKCGKMWARITPNTDIFYAVNFWAKNQHFQFKQSHTNKRSSWSYYSIDGVRCNYSKNFKADRVFNSKQEEEGWKRRSEGRRLQVYRA